MKLDLGWMANHVTIEFSLVKSFPGATSISPFICSPPQSHRAKVFASSPTTHADHHEHLELSPDEHALPSSPAWPRRAACAAAALSVHGCSVLCLCHQHHHRNAHAVRVAHVDNLRAGQGGGLKDQDFPHIQMVSGRPSEQAQDADLHSGPQQDRTHDARCTD